VPANSMEKVGAASGAMTAYPTKTVGALGKNTDFDENHIYAEMGLTCPRLVARLSFRGELFCFIISCAFPVGVYRAFYFWSGL